MDKKLLIRKQKAWKTFCSLGQVFKSKMSIPSKIKILESYVISVLTYGAQFGLWLSCRSLKGRMKEAFWISVVRGRTQTKDITQTVGKLKIRFAGLLARISNEKWYKIITEWVLYGHTRKRGKPTTTWRQEIENRIRCTMSKSSKQYKNMVENWCGLCSGHRA